MFLGVSAQVGGWDAAGTECTVTLEENPLAEFVEVPEECAGLAYCNLLCGAVRGGLEQVSWRVACSWARDPLAGTPGEGPAGPWEMRLVLLERMPESYPQDD